MFRQARLYDCAPVALFTVDPRTGVIELNETAALMLGAEREALLGRPLETFLTADGAAALRSMFARLGDGGSAESRALQLALPGGTSRAVRASARRDPAGANFLVALIGGGEGAE